MFVATILAHRTTFLKVTITSIHLASSFFSTSCRIDYFLVMQFFVTIISLSLCLLFPIIVLSFCIILVFVSLSLGTIVTYYSGSILLTFANLCGTLFFRKLVLFDYLCAYYSTILWHIILLHSFIFLKLKFFFIIKLHSSSQLKVKA